MYKFYYIYSIKTSLLKIEHNVPVFTYYFDSYLWFFLC
jgi:hypothetical protein